MNLIFTIWRGVLLLLKKVLQLLTCVCVLQVAHAFILGTAYSQALKATYSDREQKKW